LCTFFSPRYALPTIVPTSANPSTMYDVIIHSCPITWCAVGAGSGKQAGGESAGVFGLFFPFLIGARSSTRFSLSTQYLSRANNSEWNQLKSCLGS
jgi:hypothetical protein